jgi:hypothetical protein
LIGSEQGGDRLLLAPICWSRNTLTAFGCLFTSSQKAVGVRCLLSNLEATLTNIQDAQPLFTVALSYPNNIFQLPSLWTLNFFE